MKRMNRLLACLLAAICLLSLLSFHALAAEGKTGRISFSDPSATTGSNVTVKMTVSGADVKLGAVTATLKYDTGLLEYVSSDSGSVTGGDGVIRVFWYDTTGAGVSSVSFNMTFRAKAAGTATITHAATPEVATIDLDVLDLTSSGSSTITITAPPTASSNAKLSSLQISPGALSPAFSADTLEYTNSVPAGTTRLVVSANAQDSKAKVSVSGTSLTAGSNTTTVTVTAEDGTVRKYIIRTSVPELPVEQTPEPEPAITVTVDGVERILGESLEGVTLPDGFTENTIRFQEREIPAAVGTAKPLTLLWLTDDEGENGAFYIYQDGAFSPFRDVKSPAGAYTVLPLDEGVTAPEGYSEITIEIDRQETAAWLSDAAPESGFVLLYAMNGKGEKDFYRYDTVEGTLQRYVPETAELAPEPSQDPGGISDREEELADRNAQLESDLAAAQRELDRAKQGTTLFQIALAAAGLVVLILVIVMIVGGVRRRRKARSGGSEHEPVPVAVPTSALPAEEETTVDPVDLDLDDLDDYRL